MRDKLRAPFALSPPLAAVAALLLIIGLMATGVFADNMDPKNNGSRFAWGENTGWLKARPAGEAYAAGGAGVQVSDTSLSGQVWGENIGWVSLNCSNRGTCGTVPYGVTNTPAGVLGGYAWAENAGWISFSCTNLASCGTVSYGVTIDPATGLFHGQAWSENKGWIRFNCADDASCGTVSYQAQTGWPDTDSDGCSDTKELGPNPLLGGDRDPFSPWDFFDVPLPVHPDPMPNGSRNKAVNINDVVAVVFYIGTSTGGPANANGVSYDSLKDGDWFNAASGIMGTDGSIGADDKVGREFDRTPSSIPGKPWRSGPPNGAVSIQDAIVALNQVGSNCN